MTSEGLTAGTAVLRPSPSRQPACGSPNHKLENENVTMTLPADAASAVDVSLQVTDITDDQLAADNGTGDGCVKPTSTQGADWAPINFPRTARRHRQPGGYHRLAGAYGVEIRSQRCAKLGTRTYTLTVQCGDTPNSVCDTGRYAEWDHARFAASTGLLRSPSRRSTKCNHSKLTLRRRKHSKPPGRS